MLHRLLAALDLEVLGDLVLVLLRRPGEMLVVVGTVQRDDAPALELLEVELVLHTELLQTIDAGRVGAELEAWHGLALDVAEAALEGLAVL